MKRTFDQSFGSRPSAFQPVQRLAQVNNQTPLVTLPPGVPPGCPVMRSIARQSSIEIVWPRPVNSNAAVVLRSLPDSPLPKATHEDSVQSFIAVRADELRAAIREGNRESLQKILNDPAASEIAMTTDERGRNALFHAVEKNNLFAMVCLLSLSAKSELAMQKSVDDLMPLSIAASKGSVVMVQLLLGLGSAKEQISACPPTKHNPLGGNPVFHAAHNGHASIVRLLLESVFAESVVHAKTYSGADALMHAATRGHEGVVRTLLMSPFADLMSRARNYQGVNALMIAAYYGHDTVVRALLTTPCAVAMVHQKYDHQSTALLLAVSRGQETVAGILLEFGFVSEQLVGKASLLKAFSMARSRGHHGVVSLLCRHDAVVAMINGSNASAEFAAIHQ